MPDLTKIHEDAKCTRDEIAKVHLGSRDLQDEADIQLLDARSRLKSQ
jgi:hypothetical protein